MKPDITSTSPVSWLFVTLLCLGKGCVASLLPGGGFLLGLHWHLGVSPHFIPAPACSPPLHAGIVLLLPGDGESLNPPLGLFWNHACWEIRIPGSCWIEVESRLPVLSLLPQQQGWKVGLVLAGRGEGLAPFLAFSECQQECSAPLCSLERMDILISSLAFDDVSEVKATVFLWCWLE